MQIIEKNKKVQYVTRRCRKKHLREALESYRKIIFFQKIDKAESGYYMLDMRMSYTGKIDIQEFGHTAIKKVK